MNIMSRNNFISNHSNKLELLFALYQNFACNGIYKVYSEVFRLYLIFKGVAHGYKQDEIYKVFAYICGNSPIIQNAFNSKYTIISYNVYIENRSSMHYEVRNRTSESTSTCVIDAK